MKPYYSEAGIEIYHGDCREILPLLSPVDLVLTDPPYGSKISYLSHRDTLENALPLFELLTTFRVPTAFTISHSRLFDLPRRPQWIGCWYKTFSSGIVHVGACPSWEPICFYNLPRGDNGKRWDDVFSAPVEMSGFNHPCPKPLLLWKRILNVMVEGVVLDPFMGSGTTLRAAKDLGRKAIGIEIEERYCEIAANRLRQEVLQFA